MLNIFIHFKSSGSTVTSSISFRHLRNEPRRRRRRVLVLPEGADQEQGRRDRPEVDEVREGGRRLGGHPAQPQPRASSRQPAHQAAQNGHHEQVSPVFTAVMVSVGSVWLRGSGFSSSSFFLTQNSSQTVFLIPRFVPQMALLGFFIETSFSHNLFFSTT